MAAKNQADLSFMCFQCVMRNQADNSFRAVTGRTNRADNVFNYFLGRPFASSRAREGCSICQHSRTGLLTELQPVRKREGEITY
jgi:hypothetical protein